jgi:hypothetical protein
VRGNFVLKTDEKPHRESLRETQALFAGVPKQSAAADCFEALDEIKAEIAPPKAGKQRRGTNRRNSLQ